MNSAERFQPYLCPLLPYLPYPGRPYLPPPSEGAWSRPPPPQGDIPLHHYLYTTIPLYHSIYTTTPPQGSSQLYGRGQAGGQARTEGGSSHVNRLFLLTIKV